MTIYDVIIIGAGFTGVTVARELSTAGLTTLVLEARDRLGGRTWRQTYNGQHFDLGGAYVHWLQPHLWAELTRYGLALIPPDEGDISEIRLLSGGELHIFNPEDGYALFGEAYAVLYATEPKPHELFPLPYTPLLDTEWMSHAHTSLEQQVNALNLSTLQRDALRAMLATDISAPLANAALIEMLRLRALVGSDEFGKLAAVTGTYRIEGGTSALIESIRADCQTNFYTGHVVTRIDRSTDGVSILTADGSVYLGRTAILATPINTWSKITFTPPLCKEKQKVSHQMHAGQGFKCFVRVASVIDGLLALAPEQHPFTMVTASHVQDDSTWLIAFGVQSPGAFTLAWAQTAIETLIPQVQVLEVIGHDWTGDPFALGTWANFRPHQSAMLFRRQSIFCGCRYRAWLAWLHRWCD
jgi:monoamine oxidase